jgi:carboxymethylenebutenolidase
LSAYFAEPAEKPKAGLVILQEIFGVNTHIQQVTDLFSKKGYLAIAPSLFDREEKNVQLSYDEKGVSKGRKLKELCDNEALKDGNNGAIEALEDARAISSLFDAALKFLLLSIASLITLINSSSLKV